MVVLDTDHLTLLEQAKSAAGTRLRARLAGVAPPDAVTTIVTYEEQTRGWLAYMSRAKTLAQQIEAYRRLARHLDTYRSIPVLEFDEAAAVELQRLRGLRLRLGTMDLRIAAVALSRSATLLTRNLADFNKVPGLRAEDWTA
jgi:tRNA(fMet)-specific endonuclease VapC